MREEEADSCATISTAPTPCVNGGGASVDFHFGDSGFSLTA
jgi:hypothetical protein